LQPLISLSIILDAASAMYGIPILVSSLLGIAGYLYVNVIVFMLMPPVVADYAAAMIEGSGEVYPAGEKAWFNVRLIFMPLLLHLLRHH